MSKPNNEIIQSQDGSHTLMSGQFETTYHSTHGAIQESNHVFIKAGLDYLVDIKPDDKPIRIFEMGFGTGLNALLALLWAGKHQRTIIYHSIEAYPIEENTWKSINYPNLLDIEPRRFHHLHEAPWDQICEISPCFHLHKISSPIEELDLNQDIDLVFYDAFGPGTQEELWRPPVLNIATDLIVQDGVLVTYCAQGAFRRHLIALGFDVDRLDGPPGKRQMIRAVKG